MRDRGLRRGLDRVAASRRPTHVLHDHGELGAGGGRPLRRQVEWVVRLHGARPSFRGSGALLHASPTFDGTEREAQEREREREREGEREGERERDSAVAHKSDRPT